MSEIVASLELELEKAKAKIGSLEKALELSERVRIQTTKRMCEESERIDAAISTLAVRHRTMLLKSRIYGFCQKCKYYIDDVSSIVKDDAFVYLCAPSVRTSLKELQDGTAFVIVRSDLCKTHEHELKHVGTHCDPEWVSDMYEDDKIGPVRVKTFESFIFSGSRALECKDCSSCVFSIASGYGMHYRATFDDEKITAGTVSAPLHLISELKPSLVFVTPCDTHSELFPM